jgi:hypothetical protein
MGLVKISLNKINNNGSAALGTEAAISLLKTLEGMLRNRILKKEEAVHKTKNIMENDRIGA